MFYLLKVSLVSVSVMCPVFVTGVYRYQHPCSTAIYKSIDGGFVVFKMAFHF